jgi:hypothetical protein
LDFVWLFLTGKKKQNNEAGKIYLLFSIGCHCEKFSERHCESLSSIIIAYWNLPGQCGNLPFGYCKPGRFLKPSWFFHNLAQAKITNFIS